MIIDDKIITINIPQKVKFRRGSIIDFISSGLEKTDKINQIKPILKGFNTKFYNLINQIKFRRDLK